MHKHTDVDAARAPLADVVVLDLLALTALLQHPHLVVGADTAEKYVAPLALPNFPMT